MTQQLNAQQLKPRETLGNLLQKQHESVLLQLNKIARER